MIYHDPTYTSLATAPVKTINVEVAMQVKSGSTYSDGSVKWTASDKLMSVGIDAIGSFLGTATKKATVKLLGIVTNVKAGDLFQIRLGLLGSNASPYGYNNISEGFYLVDTIAYDYEAGSSTVTMYDLMWTAAKTPYTATFTYPCTVASLAQQVATVLGVDLSSNFGDLPNASHIIPEDLYANISNATMQTVIQELAASTGSSARISDMTLTFVPYAISSEILTSYELKTLTVGDQYGPVTSVVLGRMPQNDNIVMSSSTPSSTTISNIDIAANRFTVTNNGLANGSLVQITSDKQLPAPLKPATNYFIFNGGDANTFALAPTYSDGLVGTNLIDLTSAGSGNITLSVLKTQEVQINNIEILDNDRQTLLPSLYSHLLGIGWNASKADTVGLGWHEVGDVISYQQGTTTVHSFLSEVHLTLAGSIKENLVSIIPNAETINYQTAGGILKTIYDTEIKVDKQNNDIQSVVSQQLQYSNDLQSNFTEVYQTIDAVTTQIQSAGGGNYIINSVGRGQNQDGTLIKWAKSGTGIVTSYSSAGSLASGATSGYAIELVGASPQIAQTIPVATTQKYSLGFRVNKALGDGSARISLSNDATNYYIDVNLASQYQWQELKLEGIVPGQNFWNITLAVTGNTSKIEITDLRVLQGDTLSPWVQSHDEILNTQVSLTTEGIRVFSSSNPGDFTVMTPIEFKGYSNVSGSSQAVFWLNRDTTRTQRLSVADGIDYGTSVSGTGGVVRTVVVSNGSRPGIAFVGA